MNAKQEIDFSLQEVFQTIPARFEKVVAESSTRLAVQYNGRSLNYDSLNRKSNQLAHLIIESFGNQSEVVVLLLEDPVYQIIGQFGVLKSGKVCIPVDVDFPITRQAQILEDSGARIIVTESKHLANANSLFRTDRHFVTLDTIDPTYPEENPQLAMTGESLAYILYTSGTTGRPKGVMQSHKNLLHVAMLYHHDLLIGKQDRVSTPTSLAYTGTIWAMLGSLTNGAAFISTKFDSPHKFLETLIREKVTVLQLIVTLLRQFLRSFDYRIELPQLRLTYTGGEVLHREDINKFFNIFPAACSLLYNFGSTEAGMITHFAVNFSDDALRGESSAFPVGHPVENTDVQVVDESGRILPQTEIGEIAVTSSYLSPGYWKDPELTQARFLNQEGTYLTGDLGTFDSRRRLLHLGRKDRQIKIRGYRVNLEEVELAVCAIKGIAAAAVCAVEDHQRKSRIVAYIECDASCVNSQEWMRKHLGTVLPEYMIPSFFLFMDHLPIAPNGKLNRSLLPVPDFTRPQSRMPIALPTTKMEEALCGFTSEILGIVPVGIHDNLFHLGCDSIVVFQLLGRIKSTMHLDVPPLVFFDHPVVEELARELELLKAFSQKSLESEEGVQSE